MKASELRIGNYVWEHYGGIYVIRGIPDDNKVFVSKTFKTISVGFKLKELNPIPLTEEWLLKWGFDRLPSKIFGNTFRKSIGRSRWLTISDAGQINTMLCIANMLEGSVSYSDLVVLHNWDYDKDLYVHKLQNVWYILTGEELTIKE